MSDTSYQKNRNISLTLTICEGLCLLMACFFSFMPYIVYMGSTTMTAVAVLMVIPKIQERRKDVWCLYGQSSPSLLKVLQALGRGQPLPDMAMSLKCPKNSRNKQWRKSWSGKTSGRFFTESGSEQESQHQIGVGFCFCVPQRSLREYRPGLHFSSKNHAYFYFMLYIVLLPRGSQRKWNFNFTFRISINHSF